MTTKGGKEGGDMHKSLCIDYQANWWGQEAHVGT